MYLKIIDTVDLFSHVTQTYHKQLFLPSLYMVSFWKVLFTQRTKVDISGIILCKAQRKAGREYEKSSLIGPIMIIAYSNPTPQGHCILYFVSQELLLPVPGSCYRLA